MLDSHYLNSEIQGIVIYWHFDNGALIFMLYHYKGGSNSGSKMFTWLKTELIP